MNMARLPRAIKSAWFAMSAPTRRTFTIAGVIAALFTVQHAVVSGIGSTRNQVTAEAPQLPDLVAAEHARADAARKREEDRRAALTPQQIQAEALAATKAANERARLIQAAAATRALKAGLRDPDSVRWDSVLVNEDGTVACIEYGARNGFGGMNREFVVFTRNTASQNEGAWNKHCSNKQLYDMRPVAP